MSYKRRKINLSPQQIDEDNWFYDGEKNFIFVHEVRDKNGNHIQTDQFEVEINQLADFISNLQ